VVTLVPLLIALALLLVVGVAPFVGALLLLVSLVALLTWGVWKAAANLLALTGENVFRLARTPELFGRGGPDDPDWMLVPRQRSPHIQTEPLQQSVVATETSQPTELAFSPLARPHASYPLERSHDDDDSARRRYR
jgi:hypothetical protein